MDTKMKGKISKNDLVDYFHKPAFSKLLIDDPNFHALQIPTEFVDLMEEEVPSTATLNGASGGCWHVKVVKGEEGISLEDGWEKFRKDNNLARGDILLFRYSGNWCFDVEAFSPDGLEKKMKDFGENGKGIEGSKVNLFRLNGQRKKSRVVIKNKKIANNEQNEDVGPSVGRRQGRPRKENFLAPKKQGTKARNPDRANWKDPNTSKLFIDLCLEVAGGRTDKGIMTSASWEKIGLALKERKNINLTERQLKNHWNYQKRKYMIWSKVITAAGNTHYDPTENKVNWSTKQWEEHFKIHPEAKQFATKSLEYPREMMLLFEA